MTVLEQPPLELLPDLEGVGYAGEPERLFDHLQQGRYALVWWHPQTLSPLACRACSGRAEPIELLMEIYDRGCNVVGLTYESPERTSRYLQDIGLEYPVLSVGREAARSHGAAKAPGEEWESIPRRIAFLVDDEARVINRYAVHEPVSFLRVVRDDVRNGPPQSQWDKPRRKKFLGLF